MILVIGSGGQVGQELVSKLRHKHGNEAVISSDISLLNDNEGPSIQLDALDKSALEESISNYNVKIVYHLAALLSANAEKQIHFAWKLNMESLFNVLELAKEGKIEQIFYSLHGKRVI